MTYCETETYDTVSKQKLYLQLPYIGQQIKEIEHDPSGLLSIFFPQVLHFFSIFAVHLFKETFHHKDGTDQMLCTFLIYEDDSHCCQRCYIGCTMIQVFCRRAGIREFPTGHRFGITVYPKIIRLGSIIYSYRTLRPTLPTFGYLSQYS